MSSTNAPCKEPRLLMTADEASSPAGPTHMPAGPAIDVGKDRETRRKAYGWAAQRLSESTPGGHLCPKPGTASADEASETFGPKHMPAEPEIEDGKDGAIRRNP